MKLQAKGGLIGLEIAGIIAQIFMSWWDKPFKKKIEKRGMKI